MYIRCGLPASQLTIRQKLWSCIIGRLVLVGTRLWLGPTTQFSCITSASVSLFWFSLKLLWLQHRRWKLGFGRDYGPSIAFVCNLISYKLHICNFWWFYIWPSFAFVFLLVHIISSSLFAFVGVGSAGWMSEECGKQKEEAKTCLCIIESHPHQLQNYQPTFTQFVECWIYSHCENCVF